MASPLVYIGTTTNPTTVPPYKTATTTTTLYVKLVNITGVTSWTLTNEATTSMNASHGVVAIIDNINKIASVTLPTTLGLCGQSILLKSTVNNGLDSSGNYDANLVSTFLIIQDPKLSSSTSSYLRQIALGETTEIDSTYGWAKSVNIAIQALMLNTKSAAASVTDGTATMDVPGCYIGLSPTTNNAVLHSLNYNFTYNGEIYNFYNTGFRYIKNIHGSYNLILKNTSGSGTTGKFNCGAADITLAAGELAILFLDTSSATPVWLVNKIG